MPYFPALPAVWLAAANLAGLALMGWDKHCARRARRRVPEKVLFLAALLGGAAGCWAGMYLFRHKTRHWKFRILVPLFALLQWAALIAWAVYSQA